jgi:hypothetical protein
MTPALSEQVKAEVVTAGATKLKLDGAATLTWTLSAASGPALLSQRFNPVLAPGWIGSLEVLNS